MGTATAMLEAFDASLSRGHDGRLIIHLKMYGDAAWDARVAAWSIAERATGVTPSVCDVALTRAASSNG